MTARFIIWCSLLLIAWSGISPTIGKAADSRQHPDLGEVVDQIVKRTNAFRKEHKLSPASVDDKLTAAARSFAKYMAGSGKYGHEADGRQPFQRAELHGYKYCMVLENIAYKYNSTGIDWEGLTSFFVESWKKSPKHRQNMLDPNVTQTGVAVVNRGNGPYYAVQMFGRPQSEMIRFEIANLADIPLKYAVDNDRQALPPRQIRTQEVCQDPTIHVYVPGIKNPQIVTPANGDQFEFRKEQKGPYSFTRSE